MIIIALLQQLMRIATDWATQFREVTGVDMAVFDTQLCISRER